MADCSYFEWLCDIIGANQEYKSYYILCGELHKHKFLVKVKRDENRANDAIALRTKYVEKVYIFWEDQEKNFPMKDVPEATIFEMLVALAMRMEDQLLDEEHNYDRTSEWFWMMIKNLGLDIYDDENYNQYDSNKIISDTITRLNERTYHRNGTGGLFPLIGKVSKDQRKLEIWYQMMSYLDQNFILEDD